MPMRTTDATSARRLSRRWLFGCLGAGLFLGLVLAVLAALGVFGLARLWRGDGGTVAPPGDPRAFDPVGQYPAIAEFAGPGNALVRMQAEQVRSDGRLDLGADYRPAPRVNYTFVRSVPAPANAPPLGAGAPADGRWHQQVEVELSRPGTPRRVHRLGGNTNITTQYVSRGMQRREQSPSGALAEASVPPPACPLQGLWQAAIARGVPANAVAIIGYDRDGYDFGVRGTRWSLRFAPDCSLQPEA